MFSKRTIKITVIAIACLLLSAATVTLIDWTQIKNKPFLYTRDFNFVKRTISTGLSPSAKTITLANVPSGINGTDAAHYLGVYNSAGTWQENVLISGGTAVSGAASGTLVFSSVVGTYAAGWKLGSVTYGMQEMVNVACSSTGPLIGRIPPGDIPVYAKTTVPCSMSLRGAGSATVISPQGIFLGIFEITSTFVDFGDVFIRYPVNTVSGMGVAIQLTGVNSGIVNNLKLWNPWIGIDLLNTPGVQMSDIEILYAGAFGIHFKATSGGGGILLTGSSIFVSDPGGIGIRIEPTSTGSLITNVGIGGGLRCFDMVANTPDALNEVQISNFWLDSFSETGFRMTLNDAGAISNRVALRNGIISGGSNSNAIIVGTVAANQVISLMLQNIDAAFEGMGYGVYLSGTRGTVVSEVTARSGDGGALGKGLALIAPANTNVQVSGGAFGVDAYGAVTGAGIAGYGVYIDGAAHSVTVSGAKLAGSVAIVSNSSTNTSGVEFTESSRPLPVPVVASGAALAIPAFPFFTISGNTGSTSVTGLDAAHAGREFDFVPTGGNIAFTAGGTIGNTITINQNTLGHGRWDGTKVWLK